MCGIGGLLGSDAFSKLEFNQIEGMLDFLKTRGPDGNGIFSKSKVSLLHTRLSIQDVSDKASQPMVSVCGRYALVFNGEIYNFKELKEQYSNDFLWKTTSDTEVLLQLLIDNNINTVIKKIEGMYAFCFVDLKDEVAILARDKFGQKPLYFWNSNERFIFASNLNALKSVVKCYSKLAISEMSVMMFLGTGFVHQPNTVCEKMFQIDKGSVLKVRFGCEISTSVHKAGNKCIKKIASDTIEDVINKSVKKCLISDVPYGCFLSGGVDSSIITAVARKSGPLRTYCVGFKNKNYDESVFAERIANRLNTDHETYYLSDDEVLDIVKRIPEIFGEPFADPSLIPLVALSNYVKKDIKVALTGDGGDELFYGYNRHIFARRVSYIRRSKLLTNLIKQSNKYHHSLERIGQIFRINALPDKIDKLSSLTANGSDHTYWNYFATGFFNYQESIQNFDGVLTAEKIRDLDIDYYQLSNTLVKSDRSSMCSGIELRAPLLENEVSSFAESNISPKTEISGSQGKMSMRLLGYQLVGEDLLNRPKAGFTPPLAEWLEGPLASWAEEGLLFFKGSNFGKNTPNFKNIHKSNYLFQLQLWRCAIMGHWLRFNGHA